MTTSKRIIVTTRITDGPPIGLILTSLSVILPKTGPNHEDIPFGFPVHFSTILFPNDLFVVITGVNNTEYDYSNYIITGYFKKVTRRLICSECKIPTVIISGEEDSEGWLTFTAQYNTCTRKGEMDIEQSNNFPFFVGVSRKCKRFD
jgi:hypothetical protein